MAVLLEFVNISTNKRGKRKIPKDRESVFRTEDWCDSVIGPFLIHTTQPTAPPNISKINKIRARVDLRVCACTYLKNHPRVETQLLEIPPLGAT
jgi:hypothetical protein